MLKVENLSYRYSKFSRQVLDGASLELKAGEIGILLGKNGSGKTTMFKNILGTLKQLIMKKMMPLPTFTEEDYKAAEKELYGKNPPKAPKASSTGTKSGNTRSLHHIDDDEYDSKGNYIGRSAAAETTQTESGNAASGQAPAMAAPLKGESDKHPKSGDADDQNS